jgi:hypothetical protein
LAEGRHAPESSRKSPLIIGGVVVVVAVLAVVFSLSGGSDGPLGGPLGDTPEVPEFAFKLNKPIVITTAANPDPEAPQPTPTEIQAAKKKASAAAEPAATAAVEALDAYYTAAFLDPANWQDAAYEEVFATFTTQARTEAGSKLEIMTAGSEAGFAYDTIVPMPSSLRTKVLLDPKGLPTSVVGLAKFQATGTGSSGRHVFASKGQFVLQKIDGEWTIVSFSVSRVDKEKGAATSDGAPPSASASAPGSSS